MWCRRLALLISIASVCSSTVSALHRGTPQCPLFSSSPSEHLTEQRTRCSRAFSGFTTLFAVPGEGTTDIEAGSTPVRFDRHDPEQRLSVDVMSSDQKSVNEHVGPAHAARSGDARTPESTHRISREFGRQMDWFGGFRVLHFQSKNPTFSGEVSDSARSVHGRTRCRFRGASSGSMNTNSTSSPSAFRTRVCRRDMVRAHAAARV